MPSSDVKWIKIVVDIFDDEKILLIEQMPEADAIIIIWFKLLCFAGRSCSKGVLLINSKIPCTDVMMSAVFRRPLNTVKLALSTFEKLGMIETIDGVVTIPKWSKHQSLDKIEKEREYQRAYMAKLRAEQKELISGKPNSKPNSEANVSRIELELELEEEPEQELERERDKRNKVRSITPSVKLKYGMYKNVLLTDDDLQKLKTEFPSDLYNRIEKLSEYIESKGVKYKSHIATNRNAAAFLSVMGAQRQRINPIQSNKQNYKLRSVYERA
ncbi:MAG: phage replisome organizer N-terminal domain-containing protein [Eubacteriales bacterium]